MSLILYFALGAASVLAVFGAGYVIGSVVARVTRVLR